MSRVNLLTRAYFCSVTAFVLVILGCSQSFSAEQESSNTKPANHRKRSQRSRLTNDESEARSDKRRLLLSTGEDKVVDLDFDANAGANGISIGNPAILATTLVKAGDKRQIVFKPLKTGETTVTVRDIDGTMKLIFNVRVTGTNLLRTAGEIRELLRDVEGIEIRIVGPKVIIEGEVLVSADYGRLVTVVQDPSYNNLIVNLATLSPLAMQVLAKRIQEDVNTFAPNVKTRVVNGVIFLEGTVDTVDQAKKALTFANHYLPEIRPGNILERAKDPEPQRPTQARALIQSFILVNPPPPKRQDKLVRIIVHFVELSKDYNKVFGFKWEPGFTADPTISIGTGQTGSLATGAGNGGFSFSATLSSLFPKLRSAQMAGYARILNTGTVLARSGFPAKLVQQTEFPFATMGNMGQVTANKQPVGLSLAVTPLILGQSEDIQLDLELDHSNLVGRAPAAGTSPIVSTRKVITKLYVRSNESAAVAGSTANEVGTDFNKDDPQTGTFEQGTDPLFKLLRSKAYRKKKGQFVIFVTPQIVESASEGTEDMKKNFRMKVN